MSTSKTGSILNYLFFQCSSTTFASVKIDTEKELEIQKIDNFAKTVNNRKSMTNFDVN